MILWHCFVKGFLWQLGPPRRGGGVGGLLDVVDGRAS